MRLKRRANRLNMPGSRQSTRAKKQSRVLKKQNMQEIKPSTREKLLNTAVLRPNALPLMAESSQRGETLARMTLSLLWLFGFPAAQAQDETPRTYYVEEIKAATSAYIERRTDADGVFRIYDPVTAETLALRFARIHDPVRRIDGDTYFACTDFEVIGEPDQLYDLDFWLEPKQDQLQVMDEKIHKEPRHALIYGWYKHPRYTFVDDEIVPLYED
jgi:hypothetical protein